MAKLQPLLLRIMENENYSERTVGTVIFGALACFYCAGIAATCLASCTDAVYSVYFHDYSKYYDIESPFNGWWTAWNTLLSSFLIHIMWPRPLNFNTIPRFSWGVLNLGYSVVVPVLSLPIICTAALILEDYEKFREQLTTFVYRLFTIYLWCCMMARYQIFILASSRTCDFLEKQNYYIRSLDETMEVNNLETPFYYYQVKSMFNNKFKILEAESCTNRHRIFQVILLPGAIAFCMSMYLFYQDLSMDGCFNHGMIVIFTMLIKIEYLILSMIFYKEESWTTLQPTLKNIHFTVWLKEGVYALLIFFQTWTILPLMLIEENIEVHSLSTTCIIQFASMLIILFFSLVHYRSKLRKHLKNDSDNKLCIVNNVLSNSNKLCVRIKSRVKELHVKI